MSGKDRLLVEQEQRGFVDEILVAANRGPCGGVWKIFEQLDTAFDEIDKVRPGTPIYINWYPVNNIPLTFSYERRGLVNFQNDWSLVPLRSLVIPSAHGVGPDFYDMARQRECTVVADGTCQLVTRVHNLVIRAEEAGKIIVYIGKDGHPETEGVRKEIRDQDNFVLIEEEEDVSSITISGDRPKIVYSQTTLSTKEVRNQYKALEAKFPGIEIPSRWDICYATDSRQMAVEKLVTKSDFLVIVGSQISHNSTELKMIGEKAEEPIPSVLVDGPDDIDPEWFSRSVKRVAVSSGASVPDRLMYPVVDRIVLYNPGAKILHEEQVVPEDLERVFMHDANAIRTVIREYSEVA